MVEFLFLKLSRKRKPSQQKGAKNELQKNLCWFHGSCVATRNFPIFWVNSASAKTTLELWHPYTQVTRMEAMKKSGQEFEQANPGVTVKIETVPFSQIPLKWTSAYAAGILPDLMGVTTWNAVSLYTAGVLRYTDSLLEEMGGKDKVFNCQEFPQNF